MTFSPIKMLEGPLPRACSACPWRISNQGQAHPHGFYSAANLRRLWNGLRTGEAPGMTCHPTDPRMEEFEGYEATAKIEVTHQCAGSLVVVQRELIRFQAITKDVEREKAAGTKLRRDEALRRYRIASAPSGCNRGGLAEWVWRLVIGELKGITLEALNDPDIGTPFVPAWDPYLVALADTVVA